MSTLLSPDLKANQNFIQLQKDLMETENKIAYSRQFYNDTVMKYNISIQTIPKNIVASLLGFQKKELFEAVQAEKEVTKVEFWFSLLIHFIYSYY